MIEEGKLRDANMLEWLEVVSGGGVLRNYGGVGSLSSCGSLITTHPSPVHATPSGLGKIEKLFEFEVCPTTFETRNRNHLTGIRRSNSNLTNNIACIRSLGSE